MSKFHSSAKLLLGLMLFFIGVGVSGQTTIQYLNSTNVNAGIGIGGNLFTQLKPGFAWDLYETPSGSGKAEIYTAALWMSGLDQAGNLHCAAQRYFDLGVDYFDGPIVANYSANYDIYYNQVFKVSQLQITLFRQLAFPAISWQVDSSIRYWPGKGNPCVLSDYGVSIDSSLAPFVDLNHNGIYEPLLGDYPAVLGDQNVFFVFNDIRGPHTESGGTPLGVEIRGMASSFVDTAYYSPSPKSAIDNSIFIQYEIQNKSTTTYSGFDLGMYVDPDIGCFDNDYVGCDSARSMMFAYNGVPYDPTCLPEIGYDSLPIVLGVQLLSQPMDVFGYFKDCGPACPAQSDPIVTADCATYRNFLEAHWADGTQFEYGESGYNTGGRNTNFLFPGDPTDTTQWSEPQTHTVPGDRRMFGSVKNENFYPGETKHFDWGYTTSYDSTSNYISIVDTLKRDADAVRSFYLHHIIPAQQVLDINEIPINYQFTVSIYPNPANSQITIVSGDEIKSLKLMDIQGRVLLTQTIGAKMITLPVSNLAKGVYLVSIQCNGGSVVRRIVVE